MKFHFGIIPPDPAFQPDEGGWMKLKEPSVNMFYVLCIPTTVLAYVIQMYLMDWFVNLEKSTITIQPDEFSWLITISTLLISLIGIALLIIVHELIHGLFHPHFGLSDHTIFGVWPSWFTFYAFYGGEISRERFMLMVAMPYLLLSIFPMFLYSLLEISGFWFVFFPLINALFCGGDFLVIGIILFGTRRGDILRNHGWTTYIKEK